MTTSIETPELRKKLIDACIAKQQLLINNFKDRIKTLTENEGLGNEESYGSEDTASNSAKAAEINALNNQLEFANRELELLESLRATQHVTRNRVALGAIVATNLHTFFVSASLENFEVNGRPYVGISTQSPIYQAMEGKSAGETFTFKGTRYEIRAIL